VTKLTYCRDTNINLSKYFLQYIAQKSGVHS